MSRNGTQRRRRRPKPQDQLAFQLPRAAEFAHDPELSSPVFLIRALKQFPDIYDELEERTRPVYAGGRRRGEGSWALLYMAFVCSDVIDVKTWCDRWATSDVWEAAGFSWQPNYRTVWLRFTELELYAAAFERAAQKLIRRAMRHDERIGRHIHVDATHFTTNARLVHCCPDKVECARLWSQGGRGPKPKKVLTKATGDLVKAERHKASGEPEPPNGARPSQLASVASDDPRLEGLDEDDVNRHAFFELRGHLYKTRDLSAGVRHYPRRTNAGGPSSKEKFTEGGQMLMGSCDYLGVPVAVHCASVGMQEWDAYPTLWQKVEAACGDRPDAMVTDRGYHVEAVFKHNIRRGVSTIAPFRRNSHGHDNTDLECARYDRHGVVRCRHCGGPTHMHGSGLGLYFDGRDEPRLRVECSLQHTQCCKQPQTIACAEEYRLLQPINRTERLFYDLRHSNRNKESLFHHWRRRYAVAGNDYAERPKRRQSVPCQALRAAAGLLIEWFRLSLRHGWLASHRNVSREQAVEREGGLGDWRRTWDARRNLDLDLPYGPAAVELGLAIDEKSPAARMSVKTEPDPRDWGPPDGDPNAIPF